MTNYEIKKEFTSLVLSSVSKELSLEFNQAITQWWMVHTTNGGLRLTDFGFFAFSKSSVEGYSFSLGKASNRSWLSILRDLSAHLKCPYYYHIQSKQVTIYDSKIALMVSLYGDILSYIESLPKTK